jgi:hypothetical protein
MLKYLLIRVHARARNSCLALWNTPKHGRKIAVGQKKKYTAAYKHKIDESDTESSAPTEDKSG